ncbi:MAG: amino acid ABC transporter permease [Lachnospiraceae bacterium]|nr:amino acid ABC transporter permease [Lachnospiraceae bacterium]
MSFQVMMEQLAGGLMKSISIFLLTLLFALPLGLLVSFGRMSRHWLIRSIVWVFISVLRGTPLMLQLLAVYFGPFYLLNLKIGTTWRFTAIIIAFSVNYSAYFAEIYRSGIESMPPGQYEAAQLLGYSKASTFFRIIFPQVVKRILPSVTNEVITLVKDTSLAFSLAYAEMFTIAKQIAAKETSFMPFIAAAVFYYVFNAVVAFGMERIEKALNYYT